MKIASWNVNSLSVRLEQVIDWLNQSQVDVLCLQELKMETHKFPEEAFKAIGYHAVWSGQKTYNGVAILSRTPLANVQINNPLYDDEQQRLIAADVGTGEQLVRVIGVYCPNGSSLDSDKFIYKMAWFDALNQYVREQLQQYPALVLTGDFNIAPEDRDVHAKYSGDVLISPAERKQFQGLLALGMKDSFRLFEQAEKSFSWWDYRQFGFKRNAGLRIDHLLLSDALANKCTASVIDKAPRANERPSDHTPVIVELAM
ncbi:exodeoxyribonuclease III [Pelistega europaea]|uniref:Exodeoxyribonuclease III n=1 Tax=Pelistega europaea TaxID=106147 RepID=A0A7Y4L8P8_9BURK|nr:exodeoxyribonuclease III [Pelistega europaea]NOL48953.1 exodeoxyribonuclease III [Pelistega europaea]